MKIYRLGMHENATTQKLLDLPPAAFAHFAAVGTWKSQREPCNSCGWGRETIVPPLVVQWEPSSKVIGDFSWDGPFGLTPIVRDSAAAVLSAPEFCCQLHPVVYIKPDRIRQTVAFPYNGPTLQWSDCQARVELDREASGVTMLSSCSFCGDTRFDFRMEGIVIRKSAWSGQLMFRIATNGHSN